MRYHFQSVTFQTEGSLKQTEVILKALDDNQGFFHVLKFSILAVVLDRIHIMN